MFEVIFFRTESGTEPARDFIKEFSKEDRLIIGADLKTVQFGWPIGMPVCGPLGNGIFEVRTSLSSKREVRLLFFVQGQAIIVLHGILKKTQKTPKPDLDRAIARKAEFVKNSKPLKEKRRE